MSRAKIAFYDTKPYDKEFFDKENEQYNFDIKYFPSRLNIDTLEMAKGCNIVCLFVNDQVTPEIIDKMVDMGIDLIALRSAGYNNIDLKTVFKRINVVRVPAYSPYAVAEHAVGLMLSLNRKIHRAYYRVRDNNFSINGLLGFDMHGKTVGVIGTGKIGKTVLETLSGFGVERLAFDPHPEEDFAKENGFTYVDLDTLLSSSDIISLNCPLTKDTYHIIDDEAISKMKEGVMLINTGRGGLIDSEALIRGLKSKKIGSAGLDVYEEEDEYFFEDFSNQVMEDDVLARLTTFNNVLITSHQAFFTREALSKIAETTLGSVYEFVEGKPLTNEICYKCCHGECKKEETGRCFNTKRTCEKYAALQC